MPLNFKPQHYASNFNDENFKGYQSNNTEVKIESPQVVMLQA